MIEFIMCVMAVELGLIGLVINDWIGDIKKLLKENQKRVA